MKRLAIIVSTVALVTTALGSAALAGNGAPQGPHAYQLNIIGVPNDINDGTVDDWGGSGHRIFVALDDPSKIVLKEGDDFAVLDANGTDASGAAFQMPDPGLAFNWDTLTLEDPDSAYSVYIRPLGKPDGWATLTTCAEINEAFDLRGKDSLTTEGAECSFEQVGADVLTRHTGPSKFTNVTAEMLTIVLDVYEDGLLITRVRVPIFDEAFDSVFWEYDNHGLKLAQVRFYPCSTNVLTDVTQCVES